MKTSSKLLPILCLYLLTGQYAHSVEISDDSIDLGEFVSGDAWKEGEFSIPPYPQEDNLVRLEVDRRGSSFTYYLDSASLTLGKDNVVRYAVVIRSGSGAENVLYEGLRCSVNEYRTYAYGSSDGKMSKAVVSEWKQVSEFDSMVHRYNFYHYYMCSKIRVPFKPGQILQRVRYPADFDSGGNRADH